MPLVARRTNTISFAIRAQDARTHSPEKPRTSLVIIPPPNCQPASIPRLSAAVPVRLERPAGSPMLGRSAVKHRSLARLYRELYRILVGHRVTLALALVGLSLATVLKLIPPAATKASDRLRRAGPAAARSSHVAGFPSRSRNRPSSVCCGLVALVLLVSILGKFFGLTQPLASHPSHEAGPGRSQSPGL